MQRLFYYYRREHGKSRLGFDIVSEHDRFRFWLRAARLSQKRGQYITPGADHGGHRVSGQAEHQAPAGGDPEPHRLSRPLGDLVKYALDTEFFEYGRDVIRLTHRYAARENQHVVIVQQLTQAPLEFRRRVAQMKFSRTDSVQSK